MQIDSKYAVSNNPEILEKSKGNYFILITTAGPASSVYLTQISQTGTLEDCIWGPEDLSFMQFSKKSPEDFIKPPETNSRGFRASITSAAERFILNEEQIKKEGERLVTLLDTYISEKKQAQQTIIGSSIVKIDPQNSQPYRLPKHLRY